MLPLLAASGLASRDPEPYAPIALDEPALRHRARWEPRETAGLGKAGAALTRARAAAGHGVSQATARQALSQGGANKANASKGDAGAAEVHGASGQRSTSQFSLLQSGAVEALEEFVQAGMVQAGMIQADAIEASINQRDASKDAFSQGGSSRDTFSQGVAGQDASSHGDVSQGGGNSASQAGLGLTEVQGTTGGGGGGGSSGAEEAEEAEEAVLNEMSFADLVEAAVMGGGMVPLVEAAVNGSGLAQLREAAANGSHTATAVLSVVQRTGRLRDFWFCALATAALVAVVVCVSAQALLKRELEPDSMKPTSDGEDGSIPSAGLFRVFKNKRMEHKWLVESNKPLIALGAKTVLSLTMGLLVYRCVRLYKRMDPHTCVPVRWEVSGSEVGGLVLVVGWSTFCAFKPSGLYWPLVLFFFVYIPAMVLAPFQFSCSDLVKSCLSSHDDYIQEALRHADCSLEGYTAQQLNMTFILLLPWIIPRLKMMPFVWFWLFTLYFGWMVLYRHFMVIAHDTFTNFHVALHIGIQSVTLVVATFDKSLLERSQRNTFAAHMRLVAASRKMFTILSYMVPVHVVPRMVVEPGKVIAEPIPMVSCLFLIIDSFEKFAYSMSASDLLSFLNEQFSKLDDIMARNRISKVETVAEEYVACVGILPEDKEGGAQAHSKCLMRLFTAIAQIVKLQTAEVQFKMGVHTGPVIAGVIGTKLPRYRLFGDTVNTTARLMQQGVAGEAQFGEATHKYLVEESMSKLRGEVELKGKGHVKAFLYDKASKHAIEATASKGPVVGAMRNKRASISGQILRGPPIEESNTYTYRPSGDTVFAEAERGSSEDRELADEEDIPEFEDVIQKITEASADSFTPDMEVAWHRWHHVNKVCRGLDTQLDGQTAVVACLTAAEYAYVSYGGTAAAGGSVPTAFLACRFSVFLLLVLARFVAMRDVGEGCDTRFGHTRLVAWSLIAILLFFSYVEMIPDEATPVNARLGSMGQAPFGQNWSLVFVLLYVTMMRQQGLLFRPSLLMSLVAIMLMVFAWMRHVDNVVFSVPSRVLFVGTALVSSAISLLDENSSRSQFRASRAVEETQERVEGILNTLMPPLVVAEIRDGNISPSHMYKLATLCQSDLVGFTNIASTKTPKDVVKFIGQIFGSFDELASEYGIYKVETVGDAYIAGMAEAPLTETNSPTSVVLFGLAKIRALNDWARRSGEHVEIRVGIHHGECVGGIVGSGMQRYHLFGALLSGMELCESTGRHGFVQISRACKAVVEKEGKEPSFVFTENDDPHLTTSKGHVHQFEEVGGRTFFVTTDPAKAR